MAYRLTVFRNPDLPLLDTRAPPLLIGCASVSRVAPHCMGSVSALYHSEEIEVTAAMGFVNRDFVFSMQLLTCIHGSYMGGLGGGRRDRKEEGKQGSQNKALQEAIITVRRKRIISHLQYINGC